jgi:hypothetical protein
MSKTFYADGATGVVVIGQTSLIGTDVLTNPGAHLADINFHSGLTYLQLKAKVIMADPASFPGLAQQFIYWDDGGCDCFTPDTLVTLPDNSTRPIVDIQVGDKVLGTTGTINTVTFIEKVPDTLWKYLYSPDPKLKPFATVNHPLIIDGVLQAVDPVAVWDLYPWLGKPEQLRGYTIKPATGNFVYNLWLTGDGTYIANGYNTTSIMFSGNSLSYMFSKGWLTQQEVIDLLVFFTSKGKHVQYGAYLINVGVSYIKSDLLLKFISSQIRREKSLLKNIIVFASKMLGRIFHPNR